MSVSLTLIPVALTLRVVMGKNNFESWVKSMQVRVPVSLETEIDVLRTARKAGFNTETDMGSLKTHITDSEFFFWEQSGNGWEAVFSKVLHSKELTKWCMRKMEETAGRPIFNAKEETETENFENTVAGAFRQTEGGSSQPYVSHASRQETQLFPTNFRDGDLLFRTIKKFGLNPVHHGNGNLTCAVEGTKMTFRRTGDAPYSVEMDNTRGLEEVFHYLSDLDEDYRRGVQALVYENLKQRLADQQLTVESEEVREDHSIVITLNIQG